MKLAHFKVYATEVFLSAGVAVSKDLAWILHLLAIPVLVLQFIAALTLYALKKDK